MFDTLCQNGKFSKKAFLSWADREGLLQTQSNQPTKLKKIAGTTSRCVWLRMQRNPVEALDEGFTSLDDLPEYMQGELPFD